MVESAVFPTVACVCGPGELAYFAQLQPLYETHGLAMPVVVPRHSVLVIESKIRKVLDKFDLAPEALRHPVHEIAAELARKELPDDVRAALGKLRGALGEGTTALTEATRVIDPTLKGPIARVRSVGLDAVQEAEKKILHALKRKNETELNQLEKARLHLFPKGKAQERISNVLYFLARYGEPFLQSVLDHLDPSLRLKGDS